MLKRVSTALFLLCTVLLLFPTALSRALATDADTYSIDVDVANQITTVYRCSDHSVVRQMICSTGTGSNTPLGRFRLEKSRPTGDRSEWYYIGNYQCYVRYPTRIQGSILFHSIPYAKMDLDTIDLEALSQMGTKASHGCVRLYWEDAMWIAMNCPDGTRVRIYTSPLRKTALRERLLERSYIHANGESYSEYVEGVPASDGAGSLGRGSVGTRVTALQKKLIGLGFFSGRESGVYDCATVAAVSRYQIAAGMRVSGVVDSAVFRKIMAEENVTGNYAALGLGCSGPRVAQLQRALKEMGLYSGEVDGRFGNALAQAVRTCQGLFDIDATGCASAALQEKILESCFDGDLRQGDQSPAVEAMERALYALQYHDGVCDEGYGLDTVMAVRFFTRANGMAESAVATSEIRRAIFEQYAQCEQTYGTGNYTLSLTDCETRVATARCQVRMTDRKSSAGRAVATLDAGEQAIVVEPGRVWCRLSFDGKTGYARTRLLELSTRIDTIAEFNAPEAPAASELIYGAETALAEEKASPESATEDANAVNGIVIEAYEAVPEDREYTFPTDSFSAEEVTSLS